MKELSIEAKHYIEKKWNTESIFSIIMESIKIAEN